MGARIILSLCDYTGNWPRFYREAGYDVRQFDIKHGTDIRLLHFPSEPVYGILAAPPCTVFASSGARWPRSDDEMRDGLSVVDACLRFVLLCHPVFWALENPIGKLVRWLGRPRLYFQPCDYGDPYTKRTGLWGDFHIPKQCPVKPEEGSKMLRFGGRSERTKELRSATPLGFARAFYEANR